MFRLIAAIGLMAACGACSAPGHPLCAPGSGSPMQVFSLFFGEAIPGRGDLTDAEWLAFLESTVSANLPNGYTAFDASGGWMNPVTHRTVRERTKVIVVALPDTPEALAPINRIRAAYQVEFHQQLVGMTVEHACGTF